MCYEYSGWFDKIRARELRKARENIDALNRAARSGAGIAVNRPKRSRRNDPDARKSAGITRVNVANAAELGSGSAELVRGRPTRKTFELPAKALRRRRSCAPNPLPRRWGDIGRLLG